MEFRDLNQQLDTLALLEEPARRELYLFVSNQDREIGRDEAALALRISRSMAAFHLDKLVEAGLLETTFRRLSDRTGPGAGRPAKLYRRSSTSFDVSLPQRRYEMAGQILVRALAALPPEERQKALRAAARDYGIGIAKNEPVATRRGRALQRAMHALEVCGFEPRLKSGGEVVLRNCPFDSLRRGCLDLVCGMNLALIQGMLEGLSLAEVQAELAPSPGRCCVVLRNKAAE